MKTIRFALRRTLLALPLLILSSLAAAQDANAPRPTVKHYNLEKGLALDGYDPVTYFKDGGGKPVKGKKDITLKHRGVTYRFANKSNRENFKKTPERFEPSYGGWCAYAMAKGDKVEIDPESFLIEDGQLLVFYKGFFNDTRKKWQKEGSAKLKPKADSTWKKFSGEGAGRDISHFNLKKGLAIGGYDPVAYMGGASRKGKKAILASYKGVEYRFSTEAAKKTFLAKPDVFEPRYGGWCAWAMAQGKKVPVSPDAYVSDKEGTFLFYNVAKRDEWVADRAQMIKDADTNWTKITKAQ